MLKGEEVEDFKLALNILDDVHIMRSRMFDYSSLTDKANSKGGRIPNYEPLITTMRVGIRSSKYYSDTRNQNIAVYYWETPEWRIDKFTPNCNAN